LWSKFTFDEYFVDRDGSWHGKNVLGKLWINLFDDLQSSDSDLETCFK
jgi:hypothetical protein